MPIESPLLLVIGLLVATTAAQADVFDVKDFGAKGDHATLDTAAIQAAVDACIRSGGGTVRVPKGDYLCGTVRVGSNIRLELAEGATLWGSRRAEDYLRGNASLLVAEKAQAIELVGPGTLRGIGEGVLVRLTHAKCLLSLERSAITLSRAQSCDADNVRPTSDPRVMHKKCTKSWHLMHALHRMHNRVDFRSCYLPDIYSSCGCPTIGSGPRGRWFESSHPDFS